MGASKAEAEFSALQFEKSLTNLKDSQESINQCCQWCLSNRQHYKKIVNSWLNVIKRVKIEQRVVLFYLANDVVQYSKRRNYDYVDTWGTAIQKATTLVRDEKIKHKILRIFKIWEQRGVYGDEFISDLCGLINIQPTGPKNDEPHEFQSSYVINKIKNCANLEKDTDTKMRLLKEHNPKIQFTEGLINSLKDRAHVDDVEKELDVYVEHMEGYINALKVEIKNRIALISVLKQAETQLESDRKDVKTVAHAYKTYGQRVKNVQKRLEEHLKTLPSPIPSPDINAPSPSPEEDIDLPEDDTTKTSIDALSFANPGYYVPPPTTNSLNASYSTSVNSSMISATGADTSTSFLSNGFTSFLGQNLSFNISNISTTGLFSNSISEDSRGGTSVNSYDAMPKPVAPPSEQTVVDLTGDTETPAPYNPLLPPPLPPFTKNNEGGFGFNSSVDVSSNVIAPYDPAYQSSSYLDASYNVDANRIDPSFDYNSLTNPSWNDGNGCDTPESPPTFEKEGYADPIEYHDGVSRSDVVDVDHRVIPGMGDLEDSHSSLGGKDVDHRNLISLTGSPSSDTANTKTNGEEPVALPERGNLKTITTQESLWQSVDQDYRSIPPLPPMDAPPLPSSSVNKDQDYRLQFDLKAPPPPPPPPPPPAKTPVKRKPPPPPPLPAPGAPGDPRLRCAGPSPRKNEFGDEEDMDLSEDYENSGVQFLDGDSNFSLEPPPPFPDLLDDMDANEFLDDISSDLNEFSNLTGDVSQEIENGNGSNNGPGLWDPMRPPPPPFGMTANSPAFTPGIPPPPSPGNYMMNVRPNHGLLPTRPTDNPPIPPLNYGETPYFEDPTYHRGGQHNFRGRFPRGPGNGSPVGFRGRGRGRGGPPRGGRGRGGVFRPRGFFRGRGR